MSEPNDVRELKEDWYKIYSKTYNSEIPDTPATFLNVSILLFVTSIIVKICFALWTSSMGQSDLFAVHGKIKDIDARGPYIDVESSGHVERYRSYRGNSSGIVKLKKGDLIEITAWEQGQAGEYRDAFPRFYIWQITRGSEVVVKGSDSQQIKTESEGGLDRFANRFVILSLILTVIAYIRHLRIRSDASSYDIGVKRK